MSLQQDIANSIFGDDNPAPVHQTTLTKDYKAVLSRYVPSNGPKTPLTTLSSNELDRKYGQILTRCRPLDCFTSVIYQYFHDFGGFKIFCYG